MLAIRLNSIVQGGRKHFPLVYVRKNRYRYTVIEMMAKWQQLVFSWPDTHVELLAFFPFR
jgi:hypothetical protein